MKREFSISYKLRGQVFHACYIVQVYTKEFIENKEIRTKIYKVSPKYLFINKTDTRIKVMQTGFNDSIFNIQPDVSFPLRWASVGESTRINLEINNERTYEDFSVETLGSIPQQLLHKTGFGRIIRIDRYISKGTSFIKVEYESNDYPCYIIQNESKYITIEYKETNLKFPYWQYLGPESKVAFGWVYPQKERMISLKFLWGKRGDKPVAISNEPYDFSIDEMTRPVEIELKVSQRHGKYLWIALESDGHSKILRIRDMPKKWDMDESKIERRVDVNIENIGVSLVSSYLEKKKEVFFLSLQGIIFVLTETSEEKETIFRVNKVQLDNQLKEKTIYPVALARRTVSNLNSEFLSVYTKSNTLIEQKANFYSFDLIDIYIAPLAIKVEEDLINAVSEFINKLKSLPKPSSKAESTAGTRTGIIVSVNKLIIPKIDIKTWFKPSMETKSRNYVAKKLAAFFDLKEFPIVLEEVSFSKLYGELKTLLLMIIKTYQKTLESMKSGLIAGLIFSPFRDFFQIGSGLTNFISNSKKGEIVSGTGNLVRDTVAGTFGPASEVTSAMSKGILALSNDDDYIKEKQEEDQKNRPENVIEGVGFGLFSALKLVGSGLAGIITKPVEGASKKGVKGLIKVY